MVIWIMHTDQEIVEIDFFHRLLSHLRDHRDRLHGTVLAIYKVRIFNECEKNATLVEEGVGTEFAILHQ